MSPIAAPDSHRLNSPFALIALIVLFVLAHWMLWYYLELDFDAQKILAETATGGVNGVIYGILPKSSAHLVAGGGQKMNGAWSKKQALPNSAVAVPS